MRAASITRLASSAKYGAVRLGTASAREPGWKSNRERDEAGFAAIEIAGRHVDAVAEPVDDVLHFFACGVGHAAGMVDDVRRGFEGDSGLLRHFTQCDAFPVRLVRLHFGHISP